MTHAQRAGVARTLRLTKHHGLANDFLVALDPDVELDADQARALCDRVTGIGADGLVVARAVSGAAATCTGTSHGETYAVHMRLYNADGSVAEMSGNGIRCLAQAVAEDRRADHLELLVETDAGMRQVSVEPGAHSGEIQARVDMGAVWEGPSVPDAVIPASSRLLGTAELGNPHVVLTCDGGSPARDLVDLHGATIDGAVPGGANVHVIELVDRGTLRMFTYERGVGPTRACGTGAAAAAHLAHRAGHVNEVVTVVMPGGSARVELGDDVLPRRGEVGPSDRCPVVLTGPAVRVATVLVDASALAVGVMAR